MYTPTHKPQTAAFARTHKYTHIHTLAEDRPGHTDLDKSLDIALMCEVYTL